VFARWAKPECPPDILPLNLNCRLCFANSAKGLGSFKNPVLSNGVFCFLSTKGFDSIVKLFYFFQWLINPRQMPAWGMEARCRAPRTARRCTGLRWCRQPQCAGTPQRILKCQFRFALDFLINK